MNRNFKSVEKPHRFLIFSAVLLCISGSVSAQSSASIIARILYPPRNYEIALGDTITPSIRITNSDTIAHNGIKLYYRIINVVTNVTTYSDSLIIPTVLPRDSIDTMFPAYVTNPNIIKELGTFNGCLIFGDTICSRLFGIRRTALPFLDAFDYYDTTATGATPAQTLWVSLGATVVDGENVTWDPPPPRYPGAGIGPDSMVAPVIRMDRLDYNGNFYSGNDVGDTLTSFPINLQGKIDVIFSFDYMRGGRRHFGVGWNSDTMFGPESTITDSAGNVIRAGDSLILEFRNPSEPALNVFPGGWNEIAAIDGGHDLEFKPCYLSTYGKNWKLTVGDVTTLLPDTTNYLTADFRFRLRLKASDNSLKSFSVVDDADEWYIDNPRLEVPIVPSVEMSWIRVVNPYTKVPISQAIFPVFVHVVTGNLGGWVPPAFYAHILDPYGDTIYSDTIIPYRFGNGIDTIFRFRDWDASSEWGFNGAPFTAITSVGTNWSEPAELDETYSKFYLNFENGDTGIQEFAMDDAGMQPAPGAGNDIPNLTGIPGSGIGFANTTGSIAMKFHIVRDDIFYGVRVYFGNGNEAPDSIRISLLRGDSNSNLPLDTVVEQGRPTTLIAQRGLAFNQFVTYSFPVPITLQPGVYWVSVSQLGSNSMELGGNISRGGGQLIVGDKTDPRIVAMYGAAAGEPSYGTQWGSNPGDNNGDVSGSFAVETPAGSGNWEPLMPDSGLWPAMISSSGLQPTIMSHLDTFPLVGAGTYVPMIRPMFSNAVSAVAATDVKTSCAIESTFPNPFDPMKSSTDIAYVVDADGPVSITICNMLGVIVKTLVNANMTSGRHAVLWDGKDEKDSFVPSGTYLIVLRSAGHRASSKILIME